MNTLSNPFELNQQLSRYRNAPHVAFSLSDEQIARLVELSEAAFVVVEASASEQSLRNLSTQVARLFDSKAG